MCQVLQGLLWEITYRNARHRFVNMSLDLFNSSDSTKVAQLKFLSYKLKLQEHQRLIPNLYLTIYITDKSVTVSTKSQIAFPKILLYIDIKVQYMVKNA